MRALKFVVAIGLLTAVAFWLSPFTLGAAVTHTEAHGTAHFARGPGGTGGRRPIRFSVRGDPELAARVTAALATQAGFQPGGAAALRTGEALAEIDLKLLSRLMTPVYVHGRVHLHLGFASDGRLEDPSADFVPARWSYPVVRGEYDLEVEGKAKGFVSASEYRDAIAGRLAEEVARELRFALVGEAIPVAQRGLSSLQTPASPQPARTPGH